MGDSSGYVTRSNLKTDREVDSMDKLLQIERSVEVRKKLERLPHCKAVESLKAEVDAMLDGEVSYDELRASHAKLLGEHRSLEDKYSALLEKSSKGEPWDESDASSPIRLPKSWLVIGAICILAVIKGGCDVASSKSLEKPAAPSAVPAGQLYPPGYQTE